jgi:hypothetical protein
VIDPWDPRRVETKIVYGETPPPMRVIPSRAMLRAGKEFHSKEIKADFLISCADPVPDLALEAAGGPESPLVISPLRWVEQGRRARFSVRVNPGRVREGVFDVIVRRASPSSERVVVPISLRVEDAP